MQESNHTYNGLLLKNKNTAPMTANINTIKIIGTITDAGDHPGGGNCLLKT